VTWPEADALVQCFCVARLDTIAIVGDWRDPDDPNWSAIAAARSARLSQCADTSFLAKTFAALRQAAEQGRASRRRAAADDDAAADGDTSPSHPSGRPLRKRSTPDHLRMPLDCSRVTRAWWSVELDHTCPLTLPDEPGAQPDVSRRRAVKLIRQSQPEDDEAWPAWPV